MRTKKSRQLWAWMPACVVLGLSLMTAMGVSLIPSAGAANPELVTVTANVGAQLDITPTCAVAATTDIGALSSGGGAAVTASNCSMNFSSNNATGAYLDVLDNRVDGNPTFCKVGDCATAASQFNNEGTGGTSLDDGGFGATLVSVGGTAANVWTLNAGASAAAAAWYPLPEAANAGSKACNAPASTASAICNFRFAADPKAVQNSGAYTGVVKFQATANP